MASTNDVYRKIKEISKRTPNPRPQIAVDMVAGELRESYGQISHQLAELKDMRLIQFDTIVPAYIKLTLLGTTVTRK